MDDPVTNDCFLFPLPVQLFPSAKCTSYGAPVVGVPYLAKTAICHANVAVVCDAVFKKGGEEWVVETV